MKKNFMAIASLLIAAMLLVVSCAPEANVEGKVEDGLVDAKLNVAFGKAVNISTGTDARILYKYFKSSINRFLYKLVLSEYNKFNEITDSFSFF